MNSSIQPIDVRNSWHWKFLRFANCADRLYPKNRSLYYQPNSCEYGRSLILALIKVPVLLGCAFFTSYFTGFTIILTGIYQFNISGRFELAMELLLGDLPPILGAIVSAVTVLLIAVSLLAMTIGVLISVAKFINWCNNIRWARFDETMLREKVPTYKDSLTYKLYRSIVDKFCVPIRTE